MPRLKKVVNFFKIIFEHTQAKLPLFWNVPHAERTTTARKKWTIPLLNRWDIYTHSATGTTKEQAEPFKSFVCYLLRLLQVFVNCWMRLRYIYTNKSKASVCSVCTILKGPITGNSFSLILQHNIGVYFTCNSIKSQLWSIFFSYFLSFFSYNNSNRIDVIKMVVHQNVIC